MKGYVLINNRDEFSVSTTCPCQKCYHVLEDSSPTRPTVSIDELNMRSKDVYCG